MAASTSGPTVSRWYIALELARLRQGNKLTLKQVAERLGCSLSHVGHLETGRNLPARAELEVLLDFYRAGEQIPSLVELLNEARAGKDWWLRFEGVVPAWFQLFLGLESAAERIESYDALLVPSLFQIPAYTEAVIRGGQPELADEEVAQRVELHQARQDLLTRQPEPPTVCSILDESVLDGGDPTILREQLEHLEKLTKLHNVTIQVLPISARTLAGGHGPFTLLSFRELTGAPAVAYADGMVRGRYHQDASAVAPYRAALDRLRELAKSPEDSLAVIRHRIEELR